MVEELLFELPFTPARCMAITKGDCAAVPLPMRHAQQKCAKKASNILWSSAGSLYATNIPIIRTPKIYQGLGEDVKKYAFTHVEDDDAIENTVNCFGNIPTGAFGLRCSAVKRHALAWLVKKVDPKTHIATNSIPWKEKAAWTSTDRIPRNLSVLIFLTRPAPATAPGCFQYWVDKLSSGTIANVVVATYPKSNTVSWRTSSKIDNKSSNEQSNDQHNYVAMAFA